MPGIYSMSAITTALVAAVIGGLLLAWSPREDRRLVLLLIALTLPMSLLAFYVVRLPLDGLIKGALGAQRDLYGFVRTFYAPLTEEPAKLWPLLIPPLFARVRGANPLRTALALGLGFGIGEIWLVAQLVAQGSPESAALPWYELTGFLNERFMVCLLHGGFTAVAVAGLLRGFPRNGLGVLGALALHYFGNFPIYLSGINFGGLGRETWTAIVEVWVTLYFVVMVWVLIYFAAGKSGRLGQTLFGDATCPECGVTYPRPLFGMNLVTKRYERCPNCKHWHLV